MARSKVEKLPEGARKSLEEWLREFLAGRLSLDQVMERAEALFDFNGLTPAEKPSRSGVARYADKFKKVGERVRRAQEFRSVLIAEVGPQIADGQGLQVMAQAFESLVYDMLANLEDGQALDPEQLMFFARSIQSVSSALKTDTDRALRIEEQTLKKAARAVEEAAKEVAKEAARKGTAEPGLSNETVELIKARILGIGR